MLSDQDYNRVIETEKKLATDSALSMFRQKGREPEREYMDLVNQNKITQAVARPKAHGSVQASKIIDQHFRVWNAFMNKSRTRVFPRKEI